MKAILKFLSVLFFSLITITAASAADREEKVIYHISDSSNASVALRNARNHLDQSPKVKIVFVTHGPGIDFLLDGAQDKNGNPYDIAVQELAARKVEFRVCNNTLVSRNIDKSKLLPETSIVPSGVAEVSRLQIQEGYAYIKP
ncbi:MAG: DsrE family protein [Undibacterium sp.]|uniref:DsrE family protein n=1 Tax=Undibacterium sp. TaxID=1914977 RepID=UPI00271A0168|nr:DsrE family protein [Undibacterium sp.]MDO8650622.1 DsrE family protein [Undibacterium sp.]